MVPVGQKSSHNLTCSSNWGFTGCKVWPGCISSWRLDGKVAASKLIQVVGRLHLPKMGAPRSLFLRAAGQGPLRFWRSPAVPAPLPCYRPSDNMKLTLKADKESLSKHANRKSYATKHNHRVNSHHFCPIAS